VSKARTKDGKFVKSNNPKQDMAKRRDEAKREHGFGELKSNRDYYDHLLQITEPAMVKQGTKRSQRAYQQMENVVDLMTDTAEIYMPDADFMSAPSGGDVYAEAGRVPLDYIIPMTQYRSGWAFRAVFGTARDIYRNGYEFVELDAEPEDRPHHKPEIRKFFDEVDFFSFRCNQLYRERQTGLGIGVAMYPRDTAELMGKPLTNLKDRPNRLKAYSAWHLYPTNMLQYSFGDYDKELWNFRGGMRSQEFHHSRITLLETRPEPFMLRGLSVIEPIWAPAICYYNTMIFVLKSLAQVGVMTVGVKTAREVPTKEEVDAVVDYIDLFRANKVYVAGAGADFVFQNQASNIGRGLGEFLEFLKEDISSSLIIPKNQLFGRSEGGGLDGAGALVSKDDYLSALMADAGDITSEELKFLRGPCKFEKHLEGLTIRWRLDLHKTEMERLNEGAARLNMEMMKLQAEELKRQAQINAHLQKAQLEQVKADPEGFLNQMNTQVEEQTEEGAKRVLEDGEDERPKQPKQQSDFVKPWAWKPSLPFRVRRVDEGE